jgi:hypothetical protein
MPPIKEALAIQEAAGICRQPLFLPSIVGASMRLPFVLAAALALSACGNNDQTDKTQNYDENLTAENIVSNDVTAIDAVTGDAANMAADVDTNYGNLDANASGPETKPTGKKPSAESSAPKTSTAAEANTTTNAVANGD